MSLPLWKRPEFTGLVLALITLLAILTFTARDWAAFRSARVHLHDVELQAEAIAALFSSAQDLEIGQRGLLVSGRQEYLQPYLSAKTKVREQLAEADRLTSSTPSLHARVIRIRQLLDEKMAELQETIDLRMSGRLDAALAVVATGRGKVIMDRIRAEVDGFDEEARQTRSLWEQNEDHYRFRAEATAVGGSAGLFLLLIVAAVLVRRRSDAREAALRDLSASKREVEEVRDLLQTTLESMGDAVITTDSEGRVTFQNPVAEELTGWKEGYAGRPLNEIFRIVNEYTRETVESPVDKVRRTGKVAGLANHTILLARDGREIPIDDSGAPIRDGAGAISGYVLVFRNIAERRLVENALRESEDRFRTMANAAPVLLWVAEPQGEVTFLNRQWADFTGVPVDEALGAGWTAQVHPDDLKQVLDGRRDGLRSGAPYQVECRLRHYEEYRQVLCREAPRFTAQGSPAGFVAAWFDITNLKEAQEALKRSQHRLQTVVSGTTTLLWQTDPNGWFILPQPGWEQFTGQPVEEYRNGGGYARLHPDDRQDVERAWMRAMETRDPFIAEFRLWHAPSGEYRHVTSHGVPSLSPSGEVLEWVGTITDISERKRLEERLRESAKLESLGILAGGIAHDFNNLLTGILGAASFLESLPMDGAQGEAVSQIVESSQRAAALTRQMLAYSGRGRFVIEPSDLSSEVSQILPLIRSSIPKHVDVRLDLAKLPPSVEVDRGQFQQLVMNLVINGAEAIDGPAGSVTVTTYTVELTPVMRTRERLDELEPGNYLVLEVRDTGRGMDADTQKKIFDPFFTTKFAGRGLGLAAVLGIVRGHKGAIRVTSAPGSGSAFQVYLPVSGEPLATPQTPEAEAPAVSPGRTVLLVDDEDVVRRLGQTALPRYGYEVLVAANGREAIEVLAANRDRIAVIILDLTMPVMSGEEALPRLREISSRARIVASSGFSKTEAVRRFGESIDGFIQKPYMVKNLVAAVNAALKDNTASTGT